MLSIFLGDLPTSANTMAMMGMQVIQLTRTQVEKYSFGEGGSKQFVGALRSIHTFLLAMPPSLALQIPKIIRNYFENIWNHLESDCQGPTHPKLFIKPRHSLGNRSEIAPMCLGSLGDRLGYILCTQWGCKHLGGRRSTHHLSAVGNAFSDLNEWQPLKNRKSHLSLFLSPILLRTLYIMQMTETAKLRDLGYQQHLPNTSHQNLKKLVCAVSRQHRFGPEFLTSTSSIPFCISKSFSTQSASATNERSTRNLF